MLPQTVTQYLQSNQDQNLAGLFELLRFASVANTPADSNGNDPCRSCANWLREKLISIGCDAKLLELGSDAKPVVFGQIQVDKALPTVLLYGHYDVQPPDPLDDWLSEPFEPEIRDSRIYARGANDNKGQLWTHIMAVDAWKKATGSLPVNVKFFFEFLQQMHALSATRNFLHQTCRASPMHFEASCTAS